MEPVFGLTWRSVRQRRDRGASRATIVRAPVDEVRFPGFTPENGAKPSARVGGAIPEWNCVVPIDRPRASRAAVERAKRAADGPTTRPPKRLVENELVVGVLAATPGRRGAPTTAPART